MVSVTKSSTAAIILAMCGALGTQAYAVPIDVDVTMTKNAPPSLDSKGPVIFNFNKDLPTLPSGDGILTLSGVADLDGADANFTVTIDKKDFGSFGPFDNLPFTHVIEISSAELTTFLEDGHIQVRVEFSEGVSEPNNSTDYISANLKYSGNFPDLRIEAIDAVVPEPASLALLGLGLAGLILSQRKRT